MMKFCKIAAIPAMMLAVCLALTGLTGCQSGTNPTPTDPTKIAGLIEQGTSTAVSIGFVAIPDATQAASIATLTSQTVTNDILPILNGDDAGIAAGLQQILALNAFNTPQLAKAKLILEAAIPLLQAYLPPDILSNQTNKIPPDVKAYLIAFFTGVNDGCTSYLGNGGTASGKKSVNWNDLRKGLQAK